MTTFIRTHRWMPLGATLASVLVFAGAAMVFSLRWKNDLRLGVLRREAESLHAAVVLLTQTNSRPRFSDYGVDNGANDRVTALLESASLRDVIRVRWFDATGALRYALPQDTRERPLDPALRAAVLRDGATARFHARGGVALVFEAEAAGPVGSGGEPVLEVAVPLPDAQNGRPAGIAHYWLNGSRVAAEFAALDRGLFWQVGLIVLIGSTGIAIVSGWALRRLAAANRQLSRQSEDLARANQELVLAAKTSAIGAISAHLIHGLKNPLDGLEGFVADVSAGRGAAPDGEAWREAAETTRRLRNLITDVVRVLREEASVAGSEIALRDLIEDVLHKFACDAERNGVQLTAVPQPHDVKLDGRVASLAGLVLANLLGNALEASPRGAAVIFGAEVRDNEIEFQVRDHGPGLSPAVCKQLFRPQNSTKPGGSGIGLAISHQLARHVGGRLELVSSSTQGTIFRLIVPQS